MSNLLHKLVNRFEKMDKRLLFLILNALAIGLFFFVAFRYNYMHPDNMGRLMFTTPDTKQYQTVADWMFGKSASVPFATTLRPLLYPLLLGSVWQVSNNPYVFWAVQFLLWLAAINLTALAAYRFTKQLLAVVIAFCVMMINVSTMALTFYALTETLVIFLLALWLMLLSTSDLRVLKVREIFWLTFLLALLTITKPIFQLPLIIFVTYAAIKNLRQSKKNLVLAIGLIPVLLQIGINANVNGMVGVSNITEYTVKWYLLPQVYQARTHVPLDDARSVVKNFDTLETVRYLLEDVGTTTSAFLQNVGENMTGACEVFGYYPKPYNFTRFTSIAHLVLQILLVPAVIFMFIKRQGSFDLHLKLIYLFSLLIIFTSGISFNEGDRLVIIALPMWMVMYACVPIGLLEHTSSNRLPAPIYSLDSSV
ncbi:MAG: hypothetical protein HZB51_18310 [Chloroflexi bacterium]|nr:hypothetical protein [Chloroflexota bacterium]